MSASIRLDELVLLGDDGSDQSGDDVQGFHYEVSADSTKWTNAEQTITSVQSQLFDGAAVTDGAYENLSATLYVKVVAENSALLAQATAALIKVCRRPGMRELAYDAPDGASPTTVFDALKVQPALQFDDFNELYCIRAYEMTLTCKPFPRSAVEVQSPAAALTSPTFTLVDSVSSSSAWSAQDPAWPIVGAQSWQPARYNIMPNGFVDPNGSTALWSLGSNATRMGIASSIDPRASGFDPSVQVTGSPTSTTARVYLNSPFCTLRTSGQQRIRLTMASTHTDAVFGVLYRWYNASGAQIGADATVTEQANTSPLGPHTFNVLLTPPSGAVQVRIHPYARYTAANGKARTWSMRDVFVGSDGSSFWGNSATVTDGSGMPTTTYDYVGQPNLSESVELTPAPMVVSTGQVAVTAWAHWSNGFYPVFTRTGGVTTTAASPFIVVTGTVSDPTPNIKIYGVPGRSTISAASTVTGPGGAFTAYFNVGAAVTSSLKVYAYSGTGAVGGTGDGTTVTLSVTQVDTATSAPVLGTGRQGKFSLDVEGTMPAEASLKVANTGGVGSNVMIYTAPANPLWSPALSPSQVVAGTADSSSISNKKFAVPTTQPSTETWKPSHAGLVPSTYALWARVSATGLTSGTSYSFSTYQHTSPDGGSTWYGENVTSVGKILASGSTLTGAFVQLGTLRLPTVDLNRDPDGVEGLRLWVSGGSWTVDEAWLFDLVNGQVSYLALPSATYGNVTVRAASPDRPQQQYLCDNGDGTYRGFERSVQIWGNHRLDPASGCDVFAICDAATPALSVSASYFPRWDMYAAPLSTDGTT